MDNPVIHRLSTPPYPYCIFYEATENEIIIHAVRHQARSFWDAGGNLNQRQSNHY